MFAVLFSSTKYDQSQQTGSKCTTIRHTDILEQRIVTEVSGFF